MRFLGAYALTVSLVAILFLPSVLAHAPLRAGENESPPTATVISDPTKSWAIYSELHEGGEAHYYRFAASQGQRIYVGLFIPPASKESGFKPGLVLMGPDLAPKGAVPDFVEVPEGSVSMVIEGTVPAEATYEAFSPSSFYQLATIDLNAPVSGAYHIAVYAPSQGGPYGLAVGYRESFTLSEWILTPLSLLYIYLWGGQSPLLVFAPTMAILVLGIGLAARRMIKGVPVGLFNWAGALSGLLFLSTGVTVITQMVRAVTETAVTPEVGITLTLALIPLVLGIVTLALSLKDGRRITVRRRVSLAVIGVLALFTWSGFLVGPALALVSSVFPARS